MNDTPNDLDDQLTGAFERLASQAPHSTDLTGVVVSHARRARRRRLALGGAAAAVVAVVGGLGLRALPGGSDVAILPAAQPGCRSVVTSAVLPEWARAGFTDPEPVMPFVTSSRGNVIAILFTDGLYSPPRADVNNKVLWAWRSQPDPADLRVTARLNGTGPATTTGLPSPAGPSYVDLPAPGCWRLTITWPGGSDTLDLEAVAP